MLKKLVAAVVLVVVGYVAGVRAGFKAAVHDYAYNDAELLEGKVEELREEQAEELPEGFRKALEEATDDDDSNGAIGFQ